METVRQVIDDDPVPPSRLVPRLPRDLETICLKCLNKETHKRYDSAQALADDLERYRKNEPIKARPTPFWEHAAKWAKRHPLRAAACVPGRLALYWTDRGGIRLRTQIADRRPKSHRDDPHSPDGWIELAGRKPMRPDRRRNWIRFKIDLAAFAPTIENEPRLKDLSDRIAEKRKQISDQRAALQSEQAKRDRLHAGP